VQRTDYSVQLLQRNLFNMAIKNLFFPILLSFLFLAACRSMEVEKELITQDESTEVINKWLELWETYDLNMLSDIFVKSEELTYFSSEKEGLIQGFEQLRPHHEAFGFVDGGKRPEKFLWLEDLETRVYDSSALVGGIWYFGDRSLPKDSVSYGPVTFILIRDKEGTAKIVHTHFANY